MVKIHNIKGHTVILMPAKGGMTQVQTYIYTGYMHETKENLGISHLVEHIMCDSWKKCQGPCPQFWNKKGTSSNAYTSNSFVGYWIAGLKEWTKEMVEYIISSTSCEFIKKTILKDEKIAVKEELLKELNKPTWKLYDRLYQELFGHPGLKNNSNIPLQLKNLKKFTNKDVTNICKKLYVPSNIIFMITGNFNSSQVLSIFRKKLKSKKKVIKEIDPIVNIKQNVIYIPRNNAKKTDILIAFYSNIFPWDEESQYYGLIRTLMSDGLESLLLDHLRTKMNLIYSLKMSIESDFTGTVTEIRMSTQDKNIKDVVEHCIAKIRQFTEGDFHNDFLEGAKNKQLVIKESLCKNVEFISEFYGDQYSHQIKQKKYKIISPEALIKKIRKANKSKITSIGNKIFNFKSLKIIYMGRVKSHRIIETPVNKHIFRISRRKGKHFTKRSTRNRKRTTRKKRKA